MYASKKRMPRLYFCLWLTHLGPEFVAQIDAGWAVWPCIQFSSCSIHSVPSGCASGGSGEAGSSVGTCQCAHPRSYLL